eukprot:8566405-Heterocapsa_arctica.AAC.1
MHFLEPGPSWVPIWPGCPSACSRAGVVIGLRCVACLTGSFCRATPRPPAPRADGQVVARQEAELSSSRKLEWVLARQAQHQAPALRADLRRRPLACARRARCCCGLALAGVSGSARVVA